MNENSDMSLIVWVFFPMHRPVWSEQSAVECNIAGQPMADFLHTRNTQIEIVLNWDIGLVFLISLESMNSSDWLYTISFWHQYPLSISIQFNSISFDWKQHSTPTMSVSLISQTLHVGNVLFGTFHFISILNWLPIHKGSCPPNREINARVFLRLIPRDNEKRILLKTFRWKWNIWYCMFRFAF